MTRCLKLIAVAAFALLLPLAPAGASGKSSGAKPGTHSQSVKPAPKSKAPARKSPSAEQRARYYEFALQFCKKKYGRPSRIWKIDYARQWVWCEPPSY